MERLTERTADGILVKEDYGEKALRTLYQCYGDEALPHYVNCEEGYCAAERLAQYEDLEEQGLLLKLPCKVGTKVYAFLPSDNHFTECQINKIEIKPTIYGNMCYFIEPTAHRGCLYRYFENDYGKTVFLTKEEAEAKLKESEVV